MSFIHCFRRVVYTLMAGCTLYYWLKVPLQLEHYVSENKLVKLDLNKEAFSFGEHDTLQYIEAIEIGPDTRRNKAVVEIGQDTWQNKDTLQGAAEIRQWTPHNDVLSMEEALKYPMVYAKLLNSRSTVEIAEPNKVYSVGDEIRVKITVIFNPAKGNNYGGDNIRINMFEKEKGAFVSGYVINHHNGSYTGILKALWEGACTIVAHLKYTRNEVAYLYKARKWLSAVRNISAKFIRGKETAFSTCLPQAGRLDSRNGICNLTKINAGVPWFCELPKHANMKCPDLVYLIRETYDEHNIFARTGNISRVWNKGNKVLGKVLHVNIKGNVGKKNREWKPPCNKYNLSALWEQPSPTGHFYGHRWHPYHCNTALVTENTALVTENTALVAENTALVTENTALVTENTALVTQNTALVTEKVCVKNKYFLFYGDSTSLQWYKDMQARFNCSQTSGTAQTREICSENKQLGLTLHYARHNYPGNAMDPKSPYGVGSNLASSKLEDMVDKVNSNRVPIIVFNIYFHYTYYQQSVYRQRIQILRAGLEGILRKRPDAKILIKGPHLITFKTLGTSDYYAYVYRLMLMEELAVLRDKIIYLDYMDMSNAVQLKDIHPNKVFVREMVNQMLAYVCD